MEQTGAQAGINGSKQLRAALEAMVAGGGVATMAQIYHSVEALMAPSTLSDQGRATLRSYINRDAVSAGLVYPYDQDRPGWHITADGREYLNTDVSELDDEVTNAEGREVTVPSNTVRGHAFERYVLRLLRVIYPEYAWYHQGIHKQHERGLDLLGTRMRAEAGQPSVVGVQVKYHATDNAPAEKEWLKFLAGCFARRVDFAMFFTTGRLTGDQRREAAEAQVAVIEGEEELARLASHHGLKRFDEIAEFYPTEEQEG